MMKNKLVAFALFTVLAVSAAWYATAQVVLESKSATVNKERTVGYLAFDFNADGSVNLRGDLIIVRKVDGVGIVTEAAGTVVLKGKELETALDGQNLPLSGALTDKLKAILEAAFAAK